MQHPCSLIAILRAWLSPAFPRVKTTMPGLTPGHRFKHSDGLHRSCTDHIGPCRDAQSGTSADFRLRSFVDEEGAGRRNTFLGQAQDFSYSIAFLVESTSWFRHPEVGCLGSTEQKVSLRIQCFCKFLRICRMQFVSLKWY